MRKPAAHRLLAPKLQKWRLLFAAGAICCGLLAVAARAVYLQGLNHDFLQEKGDAIATRELTLPALRGNILDRNGTLLAVSAPVEALWASVVETRRATPEQLGDLARVLRVPPSSVTAKLSKSHGHAVLSRNLSPEQALRVVALGVPGVRLEREFRRFYPHSEAAAHVLGFASVDGDGQEGVELAMNEGLVGKDGRRRVLKDRKGHIVSDLAPITAARNGQDVRLSLDVGMQHLAYRAVADAVQAHGARSGSAVVLDARTGEVLALVNAPSYNPNDRRRYSPGIARNRAVVDVFEPGSTMKPLTVAAALENNVVSPDAVLDTRPGFRVGAKTIVDTHPREQHSVTEIVQRSSNIGAARLAMMLTPTQFWDVLHAAGLGQRPGLGFPGEASGVLRKPNTWKPVEQATTAYGHGVSVSLLQLARAYTLFANEGEMLPVTLLSKGPTTGPRAGSRGTTVVSPRVAQQVLAVMESVTEAEGTASLARVHGYRIAGKTGTAHKLVKGRYAPHKYLSSFVGLAPASNPRIVVAVTLDEPSNGEYYGGAVAGPVFASITAGVLHRMKVPPDSLPDGDAAEAATPQLGELER